MSDSRKPPTGIDFGELTEIDELLKATPAERSERLMQEFNADFFSLQVAIEKIRATLAPNNEVARKNLEIECDEFSLKFVSKATAEDLYALFSDIAEAKKNKFANITLESNPKLYVESLLNEKDQVSSAMLKKLDEKERGKVLYTLGLNEYYFSKFNRFDTLSTRVAELTSTLTAPEVKRVSVREVLARQRQVPKPESKFESKPKREENVGMVRSSSFRNLSVSTDEQQQNKRMVRSSSFSNLSVSTDEQQQNEGMVRSSSFRNPSTPKYDPKNSAAEALQKRLDALPNYEDEPIPKAEGFFARLKNNFNKFTEDHPVVWGFIKYATIIPAVVSGFYNMFKSSDSGSTSVSGSRVDHSDDISNHHYSLLVDVDSETANARDLSPPASVMKGQSTHASTRQALAAEPQSGTQVPSQDLDATEEQGLIRSRSFSKAVDKSYSQPSTLQQQPKADVPKPVASEQANRLSDKAGTTDSIHARNIPRR